MSGRLIIIIIVAQLPSGLSICAGSDLNLEEARSQETPNNGSDNS